MYTSALFLRLKIWLSIRSGYKQKWKLQREELKQLRAMCQTLRGQQNIGASKIQRQPTLSSGEQLPQTPGQGEPGLFLLNN